MGNIISGFKKLLAELKQEKIKSSYVPGYRVLEILQDDEGNYTVHIQLIGKSLAFHAKPEEILSDDHLVDQFSPRDIRTLTYLGYLGIHAPKYKIMAQRMLEDNKIVFAIKKRGEKEVITKTAAQILREQEILASMDPNDAKIVGYTVASENIYEEKKLKADALKNLSRKQSSSDNK